jgi:argininosuccinate lyase
LNTLFIVLKGLPLAYSKDLQEDKEPLFDAIDSVDLSIKVMSAIISDIKPNIEIMLIAAKKGYSIATDIADILVQELDIPFRESHKIVGSLVAYAEINNKGLEDLKIEEYKALDERITIELVNRISFDNIIYNKLSFGGTSPENVEKAAKEWLKKLNA